LIIVGGTRDLSQNWNIDLAQELEEYLGELEHLNIAFDPSDEGAAAAFRARTGRVEGEADEETSAGDARVMNFAEAALLIQGTSVIYSRKVEYLYALVFQTLAHLSKQQEDKHKQKSARRQRENGVEDGQDGEAGDAGDSDGEDEKSGDLLRNALPIYDELDEAREAQIHVRKPANSAPQDTQEYKKRHDVGLSRSKNNLQCVASCLGFAYCVIRLTNTRDRSLSQGVGGVDGIASTRRARPRRRLQAHVVQPARVGRDASGRRQPQVPRGRN